jgi:4-hydroxy-tetrahydrodipicolinate reductase
MAGLRLVGAVDISPELAGRPFEEVFGSSAPEGLVVTSTLEEACGLAINIPDEPSPSVVVHCTGSRFQDEVARLRECLAQGLHVVSSCEELAAPELRWPELADELVKEARERGLTILATGVNPGFVMDRLPLVAAGMSRPLERIEVRRVVDASTRRARLQFKVGAGLTPEAYERERLSKTIGHVGLAESLACMSRGLGRPITLDEIEERLEPVIADRLLDSTLGPIEPGWVAGTRQTVFTLTDGLPHLRLELTIAVGAGPPEDAIFVTGHPSFTLTIPGGLDGDPATCAALVNAIPLAIGAPAGLITPADFAGPSSPGES